MTTLDVLLLEAGPGDGAHDARELEAAGHRVHRCFDADGPVGSVHPSGWTPCRALTSGDCPLDEMIDVVLLARKGVAPRPGLREAGVRCAVRAGIPIVEDGGELLDPFAAWVSHRTTDDGAVVACEAAARDAMGPVLERLRVLGSRLLGDVGVDPADLGATFEVDADHLVVRLTGPPLPRPVSRALCARALDALRAVPRTFSQVDVGYSTAGPAALDLGTYGPASVDGPSVPSEMTNGRTPR